MDYLTLVKEKEEENRALDARMRVDTDILYLKKYVMTDAQNKAVPDIINLTLNRPAVFAANVISSLEKTSQQTTVESNNRAIDTHKIEAFQDAAFNSANARLQKQPGFASLNSFADIQLCIRGRTARRVLFRIEDGVLIPDIMPWDGRYTFYESGLDGLAWAAYKTTRSKAKIEAEYDKVTVQGKEASVLDVWDTEHNEVWIDEKQVFEQEHAYGFTPVVIQVVSLGYGASLLEKNRIEHEGESIFFLIRDIIPELNRLASILQTLNLKAVKVPVVQTRKGGGDPSDYEVVMGSSAITAMDVGEGITPINYGDARRSAEMLYNIMEMALQQGSVTNIDLGNLQFPLSAVALVEIGEGRDQVYLPRLQAKALLNQMTAEMFTRQVLQIGGTVKLGTPGHKETFSTKKLEGEYETIYKYFVKSPKTDIARMTVANSAERYFDPETILKEVLQVEDWKGVMQKRYYYMAESPEVDPQGLVRKHRIIMGMLDLAEDGDENAALEAKILATSMGLTLEQVRAGIMTKPLAPQPQPEPAIPLLGKGGQIGGIPSSAQKSAMMQGTPQTPGGG